MGCMTLMIIIYLILINIVIDTKTELMETYKKDKTWSDSESEYYYYYTT